MPIQNKPAITMLARMAVLTALTATLCAARPCGAEDWPHWRGPNRNGYTSEVSGFSAKSWPLKDHLWTTNVQTTGEASPIVADGKVYTFGHKQDRDWVHCLNAQTGAIIWECSYSAKAYGRYALGDQQLYTVGPMSTPEYDSQIGYLYTLGTDGDLNCWDTRKQGANVWHINLYDKFGMQQRPFTGRDTRDYGYTTSPLVRGEQLIVEVGAPSGTVMAFDKRTGGSPVGTPAWRSTVNDAAGHSGGLVPISVGGVDCVAVLTVFHLLVVRVDPGHEGETMALYPFKPQCAAAIVTPAVWNNLVIITTHFGPSNDLVQITQGKATRVCDGPHCEVGIPVFRNGRAYKASGLIEGWSVNASEAKRLWQGDSFGDEGSVVLTGDNKLIVSGASKLALYGVDGANLAQTIVLNLGWTSVAIANGRLYTRSKHGEVRCYRLR